MRIQNHDSTPGGGRSSGKGVCIQEDTRRGIRLISHINNTSVLVSYVLQVPPVGVANIAETTPSRKEKAYSYYQNSYQNRLDTNSARGHKAKQRSDKTYIHTYILTFTHTTRSYYEPRFRTIVTTISRFSLYRHNSNVALYRDYHSLAPCSCLHCKQRLSTPHHAVSPRR